MKTIEKLSNVQLQSAGNELLIKKLGVSGFIRYIQQFDSGRGNYTDERKKSFAGRTVDELVNGIRASSGREKSN